MWNGSVRFPVSKVTETNSNGFETVTYEFGESIPANIQDVTRNDEILAMQKGYTANLNVEIAACNYAGQSFLVEDATGNCYDVKRTYRKDKSRMLILTCELRERGEIPEGDSV